MVTNNPSTDQIINSYKRKYPCTNYFALITVLFFLIIGSSGCVTLADPEASQEYNADTVSILDEQSSLGQSFVSRRSYFNGITLWLTSSHDPANISPGSLSNTIKVRLFHAVGDTAPIYTTSIITPGSANNIPISIPIPGLKDPSGQSYYLLLTVDTGAIKVNGRLEDAYPHGQAFINDNPINADIAFRLTYNYDPSALLQDLKFYLLSSWIIFPLLVLLWLPGWLLLDVSGLRKRFDLGEQTAISTGLSLAMIPVVMLWTTLLKVKWSREAVLLVAGFLIVLFVIRLIYVYVLTPSSKSHYTLPVSTISLGQRFIAQISSHSLVLILIFLATLLVRLVTVRDLATPAWVDAVHHALITRLILANGTYPSSYLPYLNITPTVYHPGFHSIAASFVWLTNLDLPQSLIILGQVLNAFSVFSVYLLTKTLTRSSTAGIFAAFITGFLTPMPAYYTSWSRFTELTGLLLLPVVLVMLKSWLDEKADRKFRWKLGLGAITAAGLFMIHYRVVVFLACLILGYLVVYFAFIRQPDQVRSSRIMLFITAMALLSIVFILPWFIPTLLSTFLPRMSTPISGSARLFQDFPWPYLTSALGKQAIAIAGLGLLWSIIKERSIAFVITLWILLLFILANLDVIKLPGSGLITNISVEIILFIPISILGGYFISQIIENWKVFIPSKVNIPAYAFLITICVIVAFIGSKQLVAILNPITILSRQADLPAIDWVSEHIPENETVVINPFAWGYGLYAGNDGGYWIEPLTGRLTFLPPVLYGLGKGSKGISQLSQEIISSSADPAILRDYMISQNLHYIFTGVRGGVIPPEKLASSGLFNTLYHQDGVWILAVKP